MRSLLWVLIISPWFAALVRSDNLIGLLQDLVNLDFNKTSISADCKSGLIAIRNGLRDRNIWALKLLDASSHLASDFVWGNNIAPGAPRSCNLVNKPIPVKVGPNYVPYSFPNLTQIASPFPVNYRVLHARHHSRLQFDIQMFEKTVLDFGFCMPAACSNADSKELFETFLSAEDFLNRTLLDREPEFLQTKLLEMSNDFLTNPFVKGFLSIFCVILTFVLLDGAYKVFRKIFLYQSLSSLDLKKHDDSFWEKFLSCFSFSENIGMIVSSEKGSNSIPAIHGLRAISMFFFIVGHVGLFGISSVTNFQQVLVFAEGILIQPLFAMHFCVDTFYVISAMLVSYIFFEYVKTNEIKNKPVLFLKMIIKRYVRLTPSYIVEICLIVTVNKVVKYLSPFYLMDDNEIKCQRLWWQNILYINNFVEVDTMCMMWSYFLAADFQLFFISSVLLFVVIKWRKLGIFLFGASLIGAVTVCGYFGYTLPFALGFQSFYSTSKYLYTPFWCRLAPYFVGIFGGWFLSYKDRTLGLSRKFIAAGWTIAGIILLSLEFGHMTPDISPTTALFYTAFARFAWGIGICWVIVACTTGHGGFLGRFLSLEFFVPFSRLTYSAYLINPIWILIVTMLNDTPMHIDYGMLPVTTVGFVITVYTAALIFSTLFESPFIRLIKLLRI